jgi:Swt1-like HEPN
MAKTARQNTDASRRLDQVSASGVPLVALAAYSRWWAVETWLRELTYIELRAKFGPAWQSEISKEAQRRRDMDEAIEYMRSADVTNVLAYEDVKFLFTLIEGHWDLFHPSLLPSATQWRARTEELLQIRHRIGHCRHPHQDDIARMEQTLRDLEPGAWKAVTTYNHMHSISKDLEDPVVDAWLREGCSDAQRLVGHAERNYETSLRIEYSSRPWASRDRPTTIAGREGVLWGIRFVLRARRVHPVRLLMEWNENNPMPESIVHLLADDPAHLLFTISALEDPATVIDVIGRLFDAVLTSSTGWDDYESDVSDWHKALARLGHRAQWDTGLVLASDDLPRFPLLLTSAWSG